MKTIKFWLFVGLLSTPIFIYSYFRATTDAPATMTINPANDASWVRIEVQKPSSRPVLVRLLDQTGEVMAHQRINRNTTQATLRFSLSKLPAGTYRLDLHGHHTVSTNELVLTNQQPTNGQRQLLFRKLPV